MESSFVVQLGQKHSNVFRLVALVTLTMLGVSIVLVSTGGANSHDTAADTALDSNQVQDLTSFFHISDVHVEPFFNTQDMKTKQITRNHKICRIPNESLHTLENMFASDVADMRHYGRYHCDPPIELLKCALDGMRQQDQHPMFIAVSGDLSAHKIKRQVIQEATQNAVLTALKGSFENADMIVAIGNNDPWPPNSISHEALHRLWTQVYRQHLPPAAESSFLKGGYYSTPVRNSTITAIVINTLLCNDGSKINISSSLKNAWHDQNIWLSAQLQAVKSAGRKAVVVSHMPPSPGKGWTKAAHEGLAAVLAKHKDLLIAVLFGDMNRELYRTIGGVVSTVVAGLSPRLPNNPVFRQFLVDKNNEIDDIHTLYNDLQRSNEQHHQQLSKSGSVFKANNACSSNWRMLFSARAGGNLKTCSQSQLRRFVEQLMQGGIEMIQYKQQMTGAYIELHEWVKIACSTQNNSFEADVVRCAQKLTEYYGRFG